MLQGFYLHFSQEIDKAANAELHSLAKVIINENICGITDVLPSYGNLYIEFDNNLISEEELQQKIKELQTSTVEATPPREVIIAVNYNGEDLADVAEQTGLSIEEIIKRHSERSYHVYAMGFTPGFAYMAGVDEALHVPRKAIPRMKVAANTVAITGSQTGIYPLPTPGGWNLLGSTQEPIFNPYAEEAFAIQAGDEVRFVPQDGEVGAEPKRLELLPKEPKHPTFKVQKSGLLDLVVDQGRFMAGRFGLSRSGALDAPLASLANKLLGNSVDAPLLELTLLGPVLECLSDAVVVVTGETMIPVVNSGSDNAVELEPHKTFHITKGDILSFKSTNQGVRSYLAVASGFESNDFMGSCSVDLKGYIGRALQTGDTLGSISKRKIRAGRSFVPYKRETDTVTLRIVDGPQANPEALNTLTQNIYTVASADRIGIRLEGAEVAGGGILSEAVPIGAIQVTSGGMPIILLNDRGTLGGYAKPAIVYPPDLAKTAQLKEGMQLRFSLFEPSEHEAND